jgi:hypothetical protein
MEVPAGIVTKDNFKKNERERKHSYDKVLMDKDKGKGYDKQRQGIP